MAQFEALAAEDPRQVGRYRVLARLGAGGMGRVFLARSPGGRPVAVKIVRAELAEDPEFRRRFAREVAAARRVNGFFTAGVVDADPEGSPPWLATAYVAGMSLVEAVTAHGPWQESAVRALGVGLAEALEAIHAAGLVHRDLKPSNVLLAPDGPRVIDFGISLAADATALTQTGGAVGTPGFMSPEQLMGRVVTPASDVFALGAVLAYAATGEGPFGAGAAHAVNFRAAYEPAELTRVPGGLRELLAACLEKETAGRPGVAALLERLGVGAGGGAAAALDWLPEGVARSVRERTEAALPVTPPSPPTPPSPTVPNAANGGAFGPPLPPPSPPQHQPQHQPTPPTSSSGGGRAGGPSRRGLLAAAGGTAAVAGLGALALTLGGGGGEGGDGTSEGSAGSTNGGDTGGPASPSLSAAPDAQTRTVRIAVHAPLTGDFEAFGQDQLAAARLAVDEANANGGYPGFHFEIAEADDQGDGEMGTVVAESAIGDPRVLAVLGPALSDMADVVCPLYADAGLACVTPSATNSTLTEQGYGTFLRAVPDDRQSGEAIADLLAELEAGEVMVIDDSSSYSVGVADAVQQRLEELGISHIRNGVPDAATGMDGIARDVVDSRAGAVAFLGYYDQAADLAGALVERGFSGPRVSGDAVMDPTLTDLGGDPVEGWYVVSSGFDVTDSAPGRAFLRRLEEDYGRGPSTYAPRAYDVTAMIIETVVALGEDADRDTVFAELADARYDGITGEISFDARGEYGGVGPDLYQVEGGEFAPRGPVEDFRN